MSAQELLAVAVQRYDAHEPAAAQQALLEAYQRCVTTTGRIECTSAVRAIHNHLPPRLVVLRIRRAMSVEYHAQMDQSRLSGSA